MSIKKMLGTTILSIVILLSTACSTDNISNTRPSISLTHAITTTPTTKPNQPPILGGNQNSSKDDTTLQDKNGSIEYKGISYKVVNVDGGNMSGNRLPNVAVDVGFGSRVYWGLTNKYNQLIYVIANKVTLQDDKKEPVTSDGRYYEDEADVPGTEQKDLDKGHVIADSLGGVSNAYNITPQNSTLNRHGDQAYMEKVIRDAEECENFVATITYPDHKTQIPSKYRFEYNLKGKKIVDEFKNINPDNVNNTPTPKPKKQASTKTVNEKAELDKVDKNGNGKVTIAEAKAAGYSMPIHSNHWLYKFMDDRDKDGMVGE